jgi:NAD(P)H-nitrite reductase large subunit
MCDSHSDPLVCRCLQVYRSQIVDCIAVTGAETVREVREQTGAGKGCLACHCRIKELLAARTAAPVAARGATV